ncbi:hypothetical protein D3C87_1781900 [compost metagenome]
MDTNAARRFTNGAAALCGLTVACLKAVHRLSRQREAAQFILDGHDEDALFNAYGPQWRLALGLRSDVEGLE